MNGKILGIEKFNAYSWLVNIDEVNLSISRIFKIQYLLKALSGEGLYFNDPTRWDDSWEQIFGDTIEVNGQPRKYAIKVRAQCWSTNADTDAMWKVYSGSLREGVLIKINLKALLNSLQQLGSDSEFLTTEMIEDMLLAGQVNYCSEHELIELLSNPKYAAQLACRSKFSTDYERTLFYKRDSFAHENEFRLIWSKKASNSKFNDVVAYLKVPLLDLIEDVLLDPKLDTAQELAVKAQLEDAGIDKLKIRKSSLYSRPPLRPKTTDALIKEQQYQRMGVNAPYNA
jgi:hypothetical protein